MGLYDDAMYISGRQVYKHGVTHHKTIILILSNLKPLHRTIKIYSILKKDYTSRSLGIA